MMKKNYFHNYVSQHENIVIQKPAIKFKLNEKTRVDINVLLNTMKMNKKKELRNKLIYLSLSVSLIGLMAFLILV